MNYHEYENHLKFFNVWFFVTKYNAYMVVFFESYNLLHYYAKFSLDVHNVEHKS